MRWLIAVLVGAVLFVLYLVSPYLVLNRLSSAIEAKNAAALNELVDFPSVRRSLSEQIIAAYLKVTGKTERLGRFGSGIAVGYGSSVLDPLMAKLATPEALLSLLGRGAPGGSSQTGAVPVSAAALSSAWQLWSNSEYFGRRFSISLPPQAPSAERFKLEFRVIQWKWRLAAIELPAELRIRLAEELAKTRPQ